jgi:hypothetical protein
MEKSASESSMMNCLNDFISGILNIVRGIAMAIPLTKNKLRH